MRYTGFFRSCLLPLASCLLPLASCLLPLALRVAPYHSLVKKYRTNGWVFFRVSTIP
ncbi:hypothetical protein BJP36_43410 [Moorena producens JHB]|uniref:Uncharacterized protein n=1 Tax=Moorena producens (strain JHB) TaxID=1454205 RepID=A0A9Q9ST75_MOOP1|nr:hypothetical protein [Moorena producens]WAN69210.1 hypothetical protein BJP36_43410 [Moorena producens JHB]